MASNRPPLLLDAVRADDIHALDRALFEHVWSPDEAAAVFSEAARLGRVDLARHFQDQLNSRVFEYVVLLLGRSGDQPALRLLATLGKRVFEEAAPQFLRDDEISEETRFALIDGPQATALRNDDLRWAILTGRHTRVCFLLPRVDTEWVLRLFQEFSGATLARITNPVAEAFLLAAIDEAYGEDVPSALADSIPAVRVNQARRRAAMLDAALPTPPAPSGSTPRL